MAFNFLTPNVRIRLFTLLIIGVAGVTFGLYQLTTIWTSKNSLKAVKGTLQSCSTYITTVRSENRRGYEAKSQKSELIFYLREHEKKFALSRNIGSDYLDKEYGEIKRKLDRADSITVWIKKSEMSYWEPEVWQIETDRGMALEFDSVRLKERPVTLYLLLMGFACIGISLYLLYPKLFKAAKVNQKK